MLVRLFLLLVQELAYELRYAYDESGRLLGEYAADGTPIQLRLVQVGTLAAGSSARRVSNAKGGSKLPIAER
jgi:hypothetical protein